MLIHRDGVVIYCNAAAARMFGARDTADLVGRNALALVHPDERKAVAERIARMLATGEPATLRQERFVSLDGREIVAEVTGGRILYGGKPASQVCAVDITDRKRLEEQLRQAQKMESVGLLAGGIAHDFNNLLTPIIGGSELLLLGGGLPEGSEEIVREMRLAADRLKELTQQLLAFGRKQILELRLVDVRGVVEHFTRILRRTIREDVHIDVGLAPDLGSVHADPGQVEQVLLNLAVNAQDAMPGGGVLTIEARNVDLDAGPTSPPEVPPGPYVLLAVRDTGSGITVEARERLFEPFFTTKERGRGTGLGLSMVYGIVKQHGGAVAVRSAPGQGSCFEVYLPRSAGGDVAGRGLAPPARRPASRGAETVLVVEDDDAVRKTACQMLRQLGYEVLAADGADACWQLTAAHRGRIDLLLTDVILSSSNGKAVYEQLRRDRPGLKVLYMSGHVSDVTAGQGVVDHGLHFIQKPLSLDPLSAKLRDLLDGGAA